MTNDSNRPTWRPFTEYILKWGDRRRAEGNPPTDIAPPEYWIERAKFRGTGKCTSDEIETLFDRIAEGRKSLRVFRAKPAIENGENCLWISFPLNRRYPTL